MAHRRYSPNACRTISVAPERISVKRIATFMT